MAKRGREKERCLIGRFFLLLFTGKRTFAKGIKPIQDGSNLKKVYSEVSPHFIPTGVEFWLFY